MAVFEGELEKKELTFRELAQRCGLAQDQVDDICKKMEEAIEVWIIQDFLCIFPTLNLVRPCGLIPKIKRTQSIFLEKQVTIVDIWEGALLFNNSIGSSIKLM